MRKYSLCISLLFIIALVPEAVSLGAQQVDEQCLERQPVYGNYWQSERWGWYGAKRVVRTPADAQDILEKFFIHHKRDVKVVRISEKAHFFVAEVINGKGALVDLILIDKRTGRMRSMF